MQELRAELWSSLLKIIPDAEGETEDFDTELGGAERGVGWLRGPEVAGLVAEGNGNVAGTPWELMAGVEGAMAVNFSLRLTLTTEGGKAVFSPMFGADALDIGVLSRGGLKPKAPKENEAADGVMGEAPGVGAREA